MEIAHYNFKENCEFVSAVSQAKQSLSLSGKFVKSANYNEDKRGRISFITYNQI